MEHLFDDYDILVALCTPFAAPGFDAVPIIVNGERLEAATHLGMLTQPSSFAGLPVVSAPIFIGAGLPVGVQRIGAPWHEVRCFQAAHQNANAVPFD
jgi:Asp-tRNA(Asn)/Glu-tRNA(Gln) amidotransferase A subunit family amidase